MGGFDLAHLKAIVDIVMHQPPNSSSGALLHFRDHVFLLARVGVSCVLFSLE